MELYSTQRARGTVRFSFKETFKALQKNKNKKYPIYIFFNYGGNRIRYSTVYRSCYNDWDFIKQRVKNKSGIIDKDEINACLHELDSFIKKEYKDLSKKFIDEVPTGELKRKLDEFVRGKNTTAEAPQLSFYQVIDKYIEERKGQITVVTERAYKQGKKRLQEYEKFYKCKLTF